MDRLETPNMIRNAESSTGGTATTQKQADDADMLQTCSPQQCPPRGDDTTVTPSPEQEQLPVRRPQQGTNNACKGTTTTTTDKPLRGRFPWDR